MPLYANTNNKDEKYKVVAQILSAADYYRVLDVKRNASPKEIRKAYMKKSRACHPDRFVPAYPAATESFQILSMAYETLSNPSSKESYDRASPRRKSPKSYKSGSRKEADHTFETVINQVYAEMCQGEFQTIASFIRAVNKTSTTLNMSEETMQQMESCFMNLSSFVKSTKRCYRVLQFELMKLYELQQELQGLSYFSLWKRMQITMEIGKILLQLPVLIGTEFNKKTTSTRK